MDTDRSNLGIKIIKLVEESLGVTIKRNGVGIRKHVQNLARVITVRMRFARGQKLNVENVRELVIMPGFVDQLKIPNPGRKRIML